MFRFLPPSEGISQITLKELTFWLAPIAIFSFAIAENFRELSARNCCFCANLVLAVEGMFILEAANLLDTAALSLINPATPTTVAPASAASSVTEIFKNYWHDLLEF
jgi:hypothetical protein